MASFAGDRAAAGIPQRVQTAVGGDPVQPRAHRRTPLEAPEPAPGAEHRLLDHVLSVLHRAEHPVAVQVQLPAQGIGELAEGLLVAGAGTRQQLLAHALILAFLGRCGHHEF